MLYLIGVQNMNERRKFPRYYCSYDLGYYTYDSVSLRGNSVAEDISRGGMRISVSSPVRKGSVLKMSIHASSKEYPISARCRVRWVQNTGCASGSNVDAGIEFVSIEPNDIDKLLHVI